MTSICFYAAIYHDIAVEKPMMSSFIRLFESMDDYFAALSIEIMSFADKGTKLFLHFIAAFSAII